MKSRRKLFIKLICFIICITFFSSFFPAPVGAWKVKTHVYSANLVLEEVQSLNGYVELKPFGKIPVLPEYKQAILAYPEYFRAGAMAPDQLPDLIIGQTIIHPGKLDPVTKKPVYSSGMILDNMWDQLNEMPENLDLVKYGIDQKIENNQQYLAFGLGCLMHAAGDFFGHAYINKWAGGPWPEFSKLTTSEGMSIVVRHNALEAYIDSKIPIEYKVFDKNEIKVPLNFYYGAMVSNSLYEGKPDYDYLKSDKLTESPFYFNPDPVGVQMPIPDNVYHLKAFYNLRKSLIKHLNEGTLDPVTAAYIKAWVKDIDEGLQEWVKANAKGCQKLLDKNSGLTGYKDELVSWANKHVLSMMGAPDVLADAAAAVNEWLASFLEEFLPDFIKNNLYEISNDFTGFIFKSVFGVDLDTLISIEIDPTVVIKDEKLFPRGSIAKLDGEMGNFEDIAKATGQTFTPFDNTLSLMKLILVGQPGIDQMRKMAGINNKLYKDQNITTFIDSLDVGYNWVEPGKAFEQTLMTFPYATTRQDRDFITYAIFNINHGVNPRPYFSEVTKSAAPKTGVITASYFYAPTEMVVNADKTNISLYSIAQPLNSYATAAAKKTYPTASQGKVTFVAPAAPGTYQLRLYDQYDTLLAVSDNIKVGNGGNGAAPAPITFNPKPAPSGDMIVSGNSWSGEWYTYNGMLNLKEYPNKVVIGEYYDRAGKMHGIISGNKIIGTFIEDGIDTGKIELAMSADGKSLSGKSTYNRVTTSDCSWTGIRVLYGFYGNRLFNETDKQIRTVDVNDRWTGTWAALNGTSNPLSLIKSGNSLTGTWDYGNISIEGTIVSDKKFAGTYNEKVYQDAYNWRDEVYKEKSGTVEIILSDDYNSLTIRYKEDGTEEWKEREIPRCYTGLPKEKSWTGAWASRKSTDEIFIFLQIGDKVIGTADFYDSYKYTFKGIASGNKLKGVYMEAGNANDWSSFEFTMSDNGLTYSGGFDSYFYRGGGVRVK